MFVLKAWGECAPTVPTGAFQITGRSHPTYWQEPSKDKEGSFERYEKTNTKPVCLFLLVGAFVMIYISTKDPSKLLAGAFQR